MNTHDRILETTLKLMRMYGIKNVTMMDIAKECGISKKTVYEHFEDKDAMVEEAIRFMTDDQQNQLQQCHNDANDAIDLLLRSVMVTESLAKTVNPILLFELEKYHPAAWKVIEEYKNTYVINSIRTNLERGIAEGLFRNDIKLEIMSRLRLLHLEGTFNPRPFPAEHFNLHEVAQQLAVHYVYGVATLKGHQILNNYLKITEEA
ncbi:TetR/AcrR family transcriptional regulator [Chitinophaga horti]|uniref:TetR/AcrR family transcriptional regulator n=1 Tax=Chitinophaga horti TaxID=2920382 RepID=A0ABY6IZD2_9BACT|nr:TetR/AcrR family transcriptional regulator [Chitinophaga horti]UYQ92751.1 TetR/AcrR family transcriptional regulator [Chitinophaga horti]